MRNLRLSAEKPGFQPPFSGLVFYVFAASLLLPPLTAYAQNDSATLDGVSGKVLVRGKNSNLWNQVSEGYTLKEGDSVKTQRRSQTTLLFEDGSKVEVAARSFFVLEAAKKAQKSLSFSFGRMKAFVQKTMSQRFSVRTPTAVCSVRGTEFQVDVAQNGATTVDLFSGLLGVADQKGNEILLKPGESVDVTSDGLGRTSSQQGGDAGGDAKTKELVKKEVGLEMTKEEIQSAAALEMKSAVYQDGKALIDVNGNRVRVESYIVRPAANQFKLVILNARVDRFDYFFYRGVFNRALPDNLRDALVQVNGCIGTACTWYLTSRERAASNLTDVYRVVESGGHQVNVNGNADAGDNVTAAVDFQTGRLVSVAGAYFKTLFDEGDVTFNGVSHTSWEPSLAAAAWVKNGGAGITSMNTDITNNPVAKTAALNAVNLVRPPNCTDPELCTHFPDQERFREIVYSKNASGSVWDRFENVIIDDNGKIVEREGFPVSDNALFKQKLLEVNYELIITASEFQGRKIDLVVAPRILIDSGLIP